MNLGATARGAATAFGVSARDLGGAHGLFLVLELFGRGDQRLGELGGVFGRKADRDRAHAEVHDAASAALDTALSELGEESKFAGHARSYRIRAPNSNPGLRRHPIRALGDIGVLGDPSCGVGASAWDWPLGRGADSARTSDPTGG